MNLPPQCDERRGSGVIHMGLQTSCGAQGHARRRRPARSDGAQGCHVTRLQVFEHNTIEPTFTIPERPSKLDPFAAKLAAWLETENGRSRKHRRILKQLHAEQTTGRGIFDPLSLCPSDTVQSDWSEDYATIGGERIKHQVAHIRLLYCRAFLVRVYLLQTHHIPSYALWHSFRVFGGVPGCGIYDIMRPRSISWASVESDRSTSGSLR